MSTLLLALVAASIATLGGREAVRMARLSAALGRGLPLLLAGWLACAIAGFAAARLGALAAAGLARDAKLVFLVLAPLIAAADLVLLRARPAPVEPTRAFLAVLIVLTAAQLTTGAALLVFALAASGAAPSPAAAGGALGSGAVLGVAWSQAGSWETRVPLGALRYSSAALLLVAALTGAFAGGRLP